jgi:transcriptional regulator of acetoin/glycerol metabolism
VSQFENDRLAILRALELAGGSVIEAARHLGVSRATLYRRLRRARTPPPKKPIG